MKKILSFLITTIFIISNMGIYAEITQNNDDDSDDFYDEVPTEYSPMFALPDNMRGTIINLDSELISIETEGELSLKFDDIYTNIKEIGLNTVILNTSDNENIYYNLDMNVTEKLDYLTLAIQKARDYSLNVYLIYDINIVVRNSKNQSEAINKLISEIHRFTLKYSCDGIILNNYYSSKATESFKQYMENGSGIGFDNWLYDKTGYFIDTASSVIRLTNNSIPVGLMINDMWANNINNQLGSPTADSFEAYYNGFADTKNYIEKGFVDFVMLRSYGSVNDPSLPFEPTANWWGELCENTQTKMYLIHYNEKIGSPIYNWGEDQLLKQLIIAKDSLPAYAGSVFNSFPALLENKLNSSGTLKLYYKNSINEESIFDDLTMHSPRSLNYTTTEPVALFAGAFDENFDVYLNNSKITLNAAGNFYFEKDLTEGMNTFTINHKSKTYTYKIERRVIALKGIDPSIAEGKNLKVDGGTKITIEAVAYKGSTVTATINGKTATLKEGTATLNDDDPNSAYVNYRATYTVPEGVVDAEQELGKISVTASYKGYTMSAIGASITVNAKPKPIVHEIESEMFDESSLGTGEVVGYIDSTHDESAFYKYIKIINNYTQIYDAKTTGSDINPDFGQLPAGTIDYYKGDLGGFYTTDSGKRFKSSEVSIIEDYGIGQNALLVKSLGTSNGKSFIEINLNTKTGYNLQTVGNSYFSSWDTDYNISAFDSKYVYITFDNITSVTKLPDFRSNLVFSSGKWEQVTVDGIPKFRLILTLRQAGVYSGSGAYYNENGNLMLTFNALNNSLSGMTIVIDPGHGYGRDPNLLDPGAIGQVVEQEVNLAVAKELTKQLTALGANAIRLQTESNYIPTADRAKIARSYGCDIFISLHSNSTVSDNSVRGTEVYYFTPYSQPLATSISKNMASYFTNNVYTDNANKNRGSKFQLFWVTLQQDFPSVLVEMGFVNNMEDAMALADPVHQKGIAKGIVNGIVEYISRSKIDYNGYNGSENVDLNEENQNNTEVTEEEPIPEESEATETGETDEIETEEIESDDSTDFYEELEDDIAVNE